MKNREDVPPGGNHLLCLDSEYYETAYVRYDVYDSQTEVYSGFGDTEVESRAMLLIDLLDKKVLTLSDLNLN